MHASEIIQNSMLRDASKRRQPVANHAKVVRNALAGCVAGRTPIVALNPHTRFDITSDFGAELQFRDLNSLVSTCKAAVLGTGGSTKSVLKGANDADRFSFIPNSSAVGSLVFGWWVGIYASKLNFDKYPITCTIGTGAVDGSNVGSIATTALAFEVNAVEGECVEFIALAVQRSAGRLNVTKGLLQTGIATSGNSAGAACLQIGSNSNSAIKIYVRSLNERDLAAVSLTRAGEDSVEQDVARDGAISDFAERGIYIASSY